MKDALPEGWAEVPLQRLTSVIQYGYTASGEAGLAGPRMLRITDIQNGRVDWATVPGCTIDQAALKKYELATGDIVFARSGATTGKSFLIRSCPESAVFASYLIRVRGRAGIVLPEFLSQFFATPDYWEYITDSLAGNAQPNCSGSKLAALPVALAPLSEQHRIVEKAEALLEQVNRAKERLNRVPLILKRFRQAVLAAACSGELTQEWRLERTFSAPSILSVENDIPPLPELPDEWSLMPLEQVVQRLQYGTSDKADADEGTGIPVLRMGNIQNGKLDLSDLKYIGRQAANGFLVESGDVLFNRTNSPELVGKTAVVESDRSMAFASYLIRVKVKGSRVRPDFVCWWINSAWGRQWARHVRTDGVSQSNINASKLAAMPMPMPSIEEQDEALRIGSSLLKLADTIERRVQTATARANKLSQAILSKAFSGELVPTEAELARLEGRTYETAEELLKRVTALGSDAASAGKGRGRRARKAE